MEKGLSELEKLMLDIAEAKDDLKRVRGDRDLELRYSGILELLLEKEKRLTTNVSSAGNYCTILSWYAFCLGIILSF